jgi:uroporphyrin-III C-methyltransferase/precorrin-2 dehydrogenase/sirohydrochlorin ferrochelatase
MGPLARLPLFFTLEGKRAVLAGGGAAAAWKAELLSACGAQVDVYADVVSDDLKALAADPPRGRITLHMRTWRPGDLAGAAIAVGAFEHDADADAFAQAARHAGVPANVIDKPAFCDFAFGAIVNRSPLVIGICTDGAAPSLAQAIRGKIEGLVPKSFAAWAAAAQRWRAALPATRLDAAGRRLFWRRFAAHAMIHAQRTPSDDDLGCLLAAATDEAADAPAAAGSVVLVGAGPGNPELLTLKAVRALQSADVILFDDLVSHEVLDFARREARKLLVGKTGFGPSCRQEDINALMVSLARQGKRVVRLKGGDPLIFGRADEELAACTDANIPIEIVPGITAAQGAAAALQVPLTGRGRARRVQYVTGHTREGGLPDNIDWRSLADPSTTTAIYMPTRTLNDLMERAIAAGLGPDTPVLAASRATRPDQQVIRAPAGLLPQRLAEAALPGPILVVLGPAARAAYGARTPEQAVSA